MKLFKSLILLFVFIFTGCSPKSANEKKMEIQEKFGQNAQMEQVNTDFIVLSSNKVYRVEYDWKDTKIISIYIVFNIENRKQP